MQIDNRPQLSAVWLVDGPGPEAIWPLALDGTFAGARGEWYFPKGTPPDVILSAAGSEEEIPRAEAAAADGLFDPLVEELAQREVEAHPEDSPRVRLMTQAVKSWTDQLIDRTARNNLLFFRDLRTGTLDLTKAPPKAVFEVLAGRTRQIATLFPDDEERLDDALRRARAIHKKARAIYEERGIHTLYVACGLATWNNDHGAATPAAPILLAPAALSTRGASQRDFDLEITGELEVNPTLLNALAVEFDVQCDPEELLASAGMEGAIDTEGELDIAYRWLKDKASRVPGFAVSPKTVLGNFSYAKLPMVRDLQTSIEALAQHELVLALAGDPDARQAVRDRRADVDPSLPDQTPAADEFLVLDADSSQNHAINKVLAGQDLVIKGPPGTGKSQTITNLIAALAARGKSVLFVAEKRAAIDAVVGRLNRVGLGDLVLDLHGGISSKRQVARSLADALDTNATIAEPAFTQEHRRLDARRHELNEWDLALHHPREPWNVSLFDAQQRMLALPEEAETDVRLRGQTLHALTADTLERSRESLREFVGLGGLHASAASPWAGAQITTRDQVERARDLVDDLTLRTLEPLLDRLERANSALGAEAPEHVSAWTERLALWQDVDGTLVHFDDALYDEDLAATAEQLAPLGEGTGTRLSATITDGAFRAAHKRVKTLKRDGVKLRRAELLQAVTEAAGEQARWRAIGGDTAPHPPAELQELAASHEQLSRALEELSSLLGRAVDDGTRAEVLDRLRALRADATTLGRLPELHQLRARLQAAGLAELVADLAAWGPDVDGASESFEYCLMASIVDDIRLSDVRAAGFDGDRHSATVRDFQGADLRHIATTPQRVRRLVAERAHRVGDERPDDQTLVKREAAKKSRHRPVRETFVNAPDVMLSIKPCWVMSPLVVSQVLPNDRTYFDVVIFDEASQVRPAEAIPAIARGRRLVVAGDEKQLPPTDFFSGRMIAGDDEDEEGLAATSTDFESILDSLLFLVDWVMLSWHYRSADERLIAFSNAHLYGRAMLTFPGISGPECLRHVHVPWQPEIGDGEDSSNAEVERVVELILEHAEQTPDLSLGVIAMGIKHADRIEGALLRELQTRRDLDPFFDDSLDEKFFVKNLERVQGDERDVIILTVGYTKTNDGRMRYAFGPLNAEGGERRLNVAVTRARRRLTAVSSFAATDMDPEKTRRGADLLRLYLAYAETAGSKLEVRAGESVALNPFELDVRDALEAAGIPLICQYGVSGYRIDFAAQHPDTRGRLVLAIEADGASYHSAHTARDRDRLRQQVLENLGWRFHRIWSQDWFNNRQKEIDAAAAAYQTALAADDRDLGTPSRDTGPALAPSMHAVTPTRNRGARPDVYAWGQIDEFTDDDIEAVVRWIESDTLLRSREELIAETMAELGFERRGRKIVTRIGVVIDVVRASRR